MALPVLDNHDARIRYYELMLRGELSDQKEIPLPAGFHYANYADGDRDVWIAVEMSARELDSYAQGVEVWERYFAGHTALLPARMVFIENEAGEKIATATAYFDIRGIDWSGDGWLHWVAVKREWQGRGLSKPLVSHVLQIMKQLGCTHAKIPTQTTTWVACKVYLDLGFRPIEKNYVRCRDGWRIVKRLTDHPALEELTPAADEEVLHDD
ncbi:MAG: GNAT family N-acetyltransferase [Clostridia bacterium]|nr:GNAT family N-acetyltransferase [Clostridia bacterium]